MSNDVLRMQQEAEARVRRMREQSRMLVGGDVPESGRSEESMAAGRPPLYRRSAPPPPPPVCEAPGPPAAAMAERGEARPAKPGGLSGLFQDQEQLFLLLLAMLLIKNGAQIEIIVALLYLAM